MTIQGMIFRMNNLGVMGFSTCCCLSKDFVGDIVTLAGSVSVGAALTDIQIIEVYMDAKDTTI